MEIKSRAQLISSGGSARADGLFAVQRKNFKALKGDRELRYQNIKYVVKLILRNW